MALSIKIKDYEQVGEHIEFIIEIQDKETGESWKFLRRYSYLRDAHKQIKSLDSRVPEFPPKKIFGSKNPRFLEQRRTDLENYFNAIVKNSKLLEHSFMKDLLRPQDLILAKSAPIHPTTTYKKPKQGPEMQNFVDQLNDSISSKFFDLSAAPMPIEEEDIKRQMKSIENLLRNLKISENGKMPEGSHINEAYHKTTVVRHFWTTRSFEDLVKLVDNAESSDLIISFK